MDLIILVLVVFAIGASVYIGYLLSPQRAFDGKAQQKILGALQKYSKDGFLEVPLVKKIKITHDTFTYIFGLPEPEISLGLGVGQHISIHAKLPTRDHPEGEEIVRKYTPTSKVDLKGTFELVIKVYYANVHPKFPEGGIMSQFIDKLKIGDKIKISGPTGKFTYQGQGALEIVRKDFTQKMRVKRIGMIAGGTGITPMYQVLKSILDDNKDMTEVRLLFANKSVEDILIKEELEACTSDSRIKIHYTLDTPPKDWKGYSGFVTKEMVKETMPYPSKDTLIVTCGPPMMNKMLLEHLDALGYKEENVFKF